MLSPVFHSRLREILSDDYQMVITAFSQKRLGSFRINTLKSSGEDVFDELASKGIVITPFPPLHQVYTFDRSYEYAIKGSDAFYTGKIYLQSIASLLPVYALAPTPGMRVLDVCAAPGSKTTQMAGRMENTGQIIAIEPGKIRYDRLMYNVRMQNAHNIECIHGDARDILQQDNIGMFDAILLDAPCSAEGRIFLGSSRTYNFWSEENIQKKSHLQIELLQNAWKRVSPGGKLLYATCTLAPEENEAIVSSLLTGDTQAMLLPISIGLQDHAFWRSGLTTFQGAVYHPSLQKAVRILPSGVTEGFFMALIQKEL